MFGFVYTSIKYLAFAAAGTGAGLGVLLYVIQNRLIYPANMPPGSRERVDPPSRFGMADYQDVILETPDQIKIRAFLILQPAEIAPSRPTVLLLHANAGNVGHRLPLAKVFWKNMRCNVVALSYRGYGLSQGSPSEKGLKLDAQTALDYIVSHPLLEKTHVYVYGQSIGGAVSIHLAATNATRSVHGLIIENTFTSLPALVPSVIPYVRPFIPFLLHQIWDSHTAIATLPVSFPVLFLAGGRDELIPPVHMRTLHAACTSGKKKWRLFERGDHNSTCLEPGYFQAIAEFIQEQSGLAEEVGDEAGVKRRAESSSEKVTLSEAESDEGVMSEKMGSSISGESFDMLEEEQEILARTEKL